MPEAATEDLPVSITRLTPLAFLERSARVWPDRTAIVDGDTELSYAEFAALVQRAAGALRAVGVRPGDRVAFLMPNVTEMLVAHFAVPLAGAVLVAVNTRLSADEVEYILQHSGAGVLVVDSRLAQTGVRAAAPLSDRLVRVMSGDGELPAGWRAWVDFLAGSDGEQTPWTVPDENGPISINYTSGTTGRPKGVVYTHRGAYLNSLGELLHSRHSSDTVYLWTLPMFHCNGWCTAWAVTAIGGTHICLPEVRGDRIWELIRERGVTHLNGAPTVLTMMANAPQADRLDSPVVVTTAGAPPSPTTIAQMEGLGFELVHVYGLTETYGPYSVCEIQPSWAEASEE